MKRAVGIVRVSRVGGREGERFVSPEEQRQRIETACERDGLKLIAVHEELDVSGGKPLVQRPGLSAAVAAVEAGEADVVAAAYFDRLFRSLSTQAEVVERVEAAGGQVLAVDVGQVTGASAGQWLSGTMMGAVSEYVRRSIKERTAEGQARAVARGAVPWALQLGYKRAEDGTLEVDPIAAPLVRRAFQMRAEGESEPSIRRWLLDHGVRRSVQGVHLMLASRVYLGEIHFGDLRNPCAHEALIERALFERVQRMHVPRGPRPNSDRLLARLRVLQCGACGSPMGATAGRRAGRATFPVYRCNGNDCPYRITIGAEVTEAYVSEAVRQVLADESARADQAQNAEKAVHALESAQTALDSAVLGFAAAGVAAEPSAVERLAELRQDKEAAEAALDQLGGHGAARTITVARDWDKLTQDEKRELIRATVSSVVVAPGRGGRGSGDLNLADRLTINFIGTVVGE